MFDTLRLLIAGLLVSCIASLSAVGPGHAQTLESDWFGARVLTVTPKVMAERQLPFPLGAVLVEVTPGGAAAQAGLAVDDMILSLGDRPVANAEMLLAALAELSPGARIELGRVRKGQVNATVALVRPLPASQPVVVGASEQPVLMLDTGGHMSLINDIVFTPDARLLVSAADDKVIRVWDWRTGTTVRTIRGEVGAAHTGKVFAMALSPDGTVLAAGGWTNRDCPARCGEIRLYDFATGTLQALLTGHNDVVLALAFSPDGRHLVSGSGDSTAIVWDVPRRAVKHHLQGHDNDIYAVRFQPDGRRVVTGSDDATLRLWSVDDGSLIAKMEGHGSDIDRALAVRQSDGLIASGDSGGEIRLWNGRTGELVRVLAKQNSSVGPMRFSRDGRKLVSGFGLKGRERYVHVWDVETGEAVVKHDGHDSTVIAVAVSPDGQLVASGGGSSNKINVWSIDDGTRATSDGGKPVELVGTGSSIWAVGFSADGKYIGWGRNWRSASGGSGLSSETGSPIQHRLRLPDGANRLGRPEPVPEAEAGAFRRAFTQHAGLSLSSRTGGVYGYRALLALKRGERVLAALERSTTSGNRHTAFTFTADGKRFVSGGSWGVMAGFDVAEVQKLANGGTLKGRALHAAGQDFIGHDSDIWSLTASADGRFLISGSADQTVRLWNLQTAELIVSLFHGKNGEWVMWTPQGFYTGSPGGGALVGWQLNKGGGEGC